MDYIWYNKSSTMKKIIFSVFCFLYSLVTISQIPSFKWAGKLGGNSTEIINAVASDTAGNIYSTGYFTGSADFDPGVGTFLLNHSGYDNLFVSKLDSTGNFLWALNFEGPDSYSYGKAITTDKFGNVFITGTFKDTVDFDPGPGVFKLGSHLFSGLGGVFILKLDPLGNFLWVKELKGNSVGSITVDKLGNIYTTGDYSGTADFNPGTGMFNLVSAGGTLDAFISKLDINGNFVWAKSISGAANNETGTSVAVDLSGNVFTTGYFFGSVDFNPGVGTYTLLSTGGSTEAFISKLDVNGNFVWAKKIGGGSGSFGSSISADIYGNIYTAGTFEMSGDFNPGVGTYTLASNGYLDAFISKLDSSGNFVWAKSFGGAFSNDYIYTLGMDAAGFLYLTGSFQSTTDFDPSTSSYTITAIGNNDCFVSKFNQAGLFVWVNTFGSISNTCESNSIAFEPSGNIYSAGYFKGIVDFDSSVGTYTVQAGAGPDGFICKQYDCSVPPNPVNVTSIANANICANSAATLTVLSYGTVKWYSSPTSTVVLGIGSSFITPTLSLGTYTYFAEASTCAISASRTAVTLSVMTVPNITIVGSNTLCLGSSTSFTANGATTYTWNTGSTTSSINVSPTASVIYSVTGTQSNNCTNTQTISVIVNPNCQDVWPGDANSDGIADNLDVLELGLHYTQTGPPRASTSNTWQSYFANNWTGTITNGKSLNHSDCNGDGTINDNDTLAIYNNYGLTHAFKPVQTTTVNPQLSIVPDQAAVVKGNWGTASIYLGDAITSISNINGLAFTVDFDNTLIETNSIYIEYQNSFLDAGQNLKFRKLNFPNSKLFTATTHTVNNNVSGNDLIAKLHYQIKSSLTTDQVLTLGISQANQSDASGTIVPLTSGTGTLMAIGASVGLKELNGNNVSISPNPTNGSLTINSTTELQKIEVVSITGALLLSEVPTNVSHTLHLQNFANGIYFVNVYQNDIIVKREKIVLNK